MIAYIDWVKMRSRRAMIAYIDWVRMRSRWAMIVYIDWVRGLFVFRSLKAESSRSETRIRVHTDRSPGHEVRGSKHGGQANRGGVARRSCTGSLWSGRLG